MGDCIVNAIPLLQMAELTQLFSFGKVKQQL